MSEAATQPTRARPKPEMSAIGYLVAAGSLLLLLPILPFLAVLWIADRLRGGREPGEDGGTHAR